MAFDHCRVVLPWFAFAHSERPVDRLRRRAMELDRKPGEKAPSRVIAAPLYLASSLRQIFLIWKEKARGAEALSGRSRWVQLLDLCYAAWRHNHSPQDYYLQKFWRLGKRRRMRDYFSHREHVLIVQEFERRSPVLEFDDKLNLHRHLRAGDVETIPILMVARDGQWSPEFTMPESLALDHDLVIKPSDGSICEGLFICRWQPERRSHECSYGELLGDGRVLIHRPVKNREELLAHILAQSEGRNILVQPRQFNHPSLEEISPGDVANFRIVTGILDGEVRMETTILRLGFDVEKYPVECYIAPVNAEQGTLGISTGRVDYWGLRTHHVQTGARVEGRRIERWADLQSLAVRAHACFPWMPVIGWDVIHTREGPRIMEGNVAWGADISQIGAVLGETRYADCMLQGLDRLDAQTGCDERVDETAGVSGCCAVV